MCSVPPSAQGLLQGHTHSDGVRRVEGRVRTVEGRVGSVEVRVMRMEVRVRRAVWRVRREDVRGRLVGGESCHSPFTQPLVQCMC